MAKKSTGLKTYTALSRIRHDGDLYERGDQIELTQEQSKQLLEAGVIKPFLAPQSVPVNPPVTPDPPAPVAVEQDTAAVGDAE